MVVHNLEEVCIKVNASHRGHMAILPGKNDGTSLPLEAMLLVSSGVEGRNERPSSTQEAESAVPKVLERL